jgi:hypothetical protein
VDLPLAERPVSHTVQPRWPALASRSARVTSGGWYVMLVDLGCCADSIYFLYAQVLANVLFFSSFLFLLFFPHLSSCFHFTSVGGFALLHTYFHEPPAPLA